MENDTQIRTCPVVGEDEDIQAMLDAEYLCDAAAPTADEIDALVRSELRSRGDEPGPRNWYGYY